MNRRNTSGGRRLPSPKKRKPIRRHPNPFVQSDIEDAERTLKWLRKEDMSRELQWIDKDKGIPTAWYAAEVRRYYSVVRATIGHGKLRRTHGGASVWDNKEIAQCFAFRNATWQLLPSRRLGQTPKRMFLQPS